MKSTNQAENKDSNSTFCDLVFPTTKKQLAITGEDQKHQGPLPISAANVYNVYNCHPPVVGRNNFFQSKKDVKSNQPESENCFTRAIKSCFADLVTRCCRR